MSERHVPILIVGGTCGGVAAALAAARRGARVLVAEPLRWVGGQLTAQGVPPDEHRWIERGWDGPGGIGGSASPCCSASYTALREGVRDLCRADPRLLARYRADPQLNPGGGWVSRLCASPADIQRVLRAMLAPHIAAGLIDLRTGWTPVRAETTGDRIGAITFVDAEGTEHTVTADLVLDATDLGDVLDLARVEHAIGAEAQSVYNELNARTDLGPGQRLDLLDQQACTWCFAVEHLPGEDFVGAAPTRYDFWRSYIPDMPASPDRPWTGRLFSWTVPSHNEAGRREFNLVPWPDQPESGAWELWRYRRIVDRAKHNADSDAGDPPPDVSLFNCVQIDAWHKPLLGVSAAERAAALAEARELSLCFLHWMRTEAPRHDGSGVGYPGLRLRGEELGTADGLAMACYIREPRRLLARTMLTEAHLGVDQRRHEKRANTDATTYNPYGCAEPFADSVGIGHYPIDLHPSCAGRNSVYIPAAPYRIPMGALIPVRVANLLAAGKCLGASHIANSTTRMHHSEWAIGEAAGTLAAWCVAHREHTAAGTVAVDPVSVHAREQSVHDVQRWLHEDGVPLAWPWEV